MPASSHRRILGVVFAVGLVVALGAYVRQWGYGSLPAGVACSDFAFPVRCGALEADECRHLQFIAESWPPGTRLELQDAAGRTMAVTLELREGPAVLVLTGVGGLVFLLTAAVFFIPRSGQPGVNGFFWITFLYGLSIMAGGVFLPRDDGVRVGIISIVQILCLSALPAVFLHLALTFPRGDGRPAGRRFLVPAVVVVAAASASAHAAAYLGYARGPSAEAFARLDQAHAASDLVMVVLAVAGVTLFALRSRRVELDRERRQLRWLLWGFAIGAAPYVFLRTVPNLVGLEPLLPAAFDRVVELAIPVSFVGAVVWHRFLDIDVIIRRSLLYGILAGVLLLVYLGAGVLFGRWLASLRTFDPWLLPVVLGLGAGIAFLPLKRVIGAAVDRTFFKIASGYERSLEALDRELAAVADRPGLIDAVLRCVDGTLAPRRTAVGVVRGQHVVAEGDGDLAAVRDHLADEGRAGGLIAAPRATGRPELEAASFPAGLAAAGFVLVQPLDGRGPPPGAICIGPRATGRCWIREDLDFLAACAHLAGVHLERIMLQQAVVAESLARERLAEIDRLKTEFLSRVAHDLRTPAAGIAWSARNLLDGLAGEVTPAQSEYLRAIAGSGDHLNRLVDNLLEISRLDRSGPGALREDFAMDVIWREAARMLAPFALSKEVTVVVDGADGLPLVRGDRDAMMAVATNILDNAIKYTPAGTTVTVTVGAESGVVAAAVRDRGPGLGGQAVGALCARFAQGAPSPHSPRKGFGLGLNIAATSLERMGGVLVAGDHPDGGAVFTCRLPRAPAADGAPDKGQ